MTALGYRHIYRACSKALGFGVCVLCLAAVVLVGVAIIIFLIRMILLRPMARVVVVRSSSSSMS